MFSRPPDHPLKPAPPPWIPSRPATAALAPRPGQSDCTLLEAGSAPVCLPRRVQAGRKRARGHRATLPRAAPRASSPHCCAPARPGTCHLCRSPPCAERALLVLPTVAPLILWRKRPGPHQPGLLSPALHLQPRFFACMLNARSTRHPILCNCPLNLTRRAQQPFPHALTLCCSRQKQSTPPSHRSHAVRFYYTHLHRPRRRPRWLLMTLRPPTPSAAGY